MGVHYKLYNSDHSDQICTNARMLRVISICIIKDNVHYGPYYSSYYTAVVEFLLNHQTVYNMLLVETIHTTDTNNHDYFI